MTSRLAKKARVDVVRCERDESTCCALLSEEDGEENLFCLYSSEALEDDEKQAAEEEDNSTVIYQAGMDAGCFLQSLPPPSHFGPQLEAIIRQHGTLPAAACLRTPTLVLDLDETLVHSSVAPMPSPDYEFPVELDGSLFTVYCKKRPHCDAFLAACRAMGWEMCVFTASKRVYADQVLDRLDPSGALLGGRSQRLFREHCIGYGGNFLKHLGVLQRDLARTVIVDNSPSAFALQTENGIPIESWFEDANDMELHKLQALLATLVSAPDVRPLLMAHFGAK